MKLQSFFLVVGLSALTYSCSLNSDTVNSLNQFSSDTTAVLTYLRQNKISASKLDPGIWFVVDSAASGIRPVFNDSVSINYTMKLLSSGAIVDQTTSPLTMTLGNWINGVQVVLPHFQEGEKGRIFMPSYFGYGASATNSVPANSNLLFEFKIVKVYDHQLTVDTAAIGSYVRAHSINAIKDPSGVRYSFDTLGTGVPPHLADYVTVTYTAKVLGSNEIIDQKTTPAKLPLQTLIMGWQIGLANVPPGSLVTLYVPSRLAYGNSAVGTIPPNSNMVFKIKLLAVSSN
jgi:FKBP-type peptidyl-prolyl cis-trans isomerase